MANEVVWALAGLALIMIELMTGTFYLLIFGVAALVAAGAAWLGAGLIAQVCVAALAGLVGVFVVRRRRHAWQGRGSVEPIDIGQTGTFEAWVHAPARHARVYYRGAPWDAVVEGSRELEPGATVVVTAVRGTRLEVK